jgi:hypothetical protein
MVMLRDQHAVQNHNIYIYTGNKALERVEHFIYFGTYLMHQNSFHEEIKCSLQSGNACCYSVLNLLSSSLLSNNIRVKMYRSIILCAVLYECETWSTTVSEVYRLRVFGNRVLRKIFGPTRDEVMGK